MTYTVVTSGQVTTGTVINDGDVEQITQFGSSVSATVNSGGEQDVFGRRGNPGTAIGAIVNSGGLQDVSAGVAYGTVVNAGGTALVENHALMSGATVSGAGALLTVANDANVSDTVVQSGATLSVGNLGSATVTTVSAGGLLLLNGSGGATTVTISSGGSATVTSGGTLNAVTILDGGYVYVSTNGAETSGTISSGGLEVIDNGGAGYTTISGGGVQVLMNGGTGSYQTVSSGGQVIVSSGGIGQRGVVEVGGSVVVSSGGLAAQMIINSGGAETVLSSGTANATSVGAGGLLDIQSGGVANGGINSAGLVHVESGGTAFGITVYNGGVENVDAGGLASGGLVYGATLNDSGSADGITVGTSGNAGTLNISSGAVAHGTVLVTGNVYVLSGAAASGTVISGGTERVSAGGTETSGVQISGVQNVYGTIISQTLRGGTENLIGYASGTIVSGGTESVQNAGVSFGAMVVGGTESLIIGGTSISANVTSFGTQAIYNGTASGAVVSNGGQQVVFANAYDTIVGSGGVQTTYANASNTIVSSGGTEFVYGGTASNTTAAGSVVVSGGTTVSAILSSGGTELVSSGGVASSTTVNSGAFISAAGGLLSGTTVLGGGELDLYGSGTASATTLSSGATQRVFSGGTAVDTVIMGGAAYVSSGGVDLNAILSGGTMTVASSGTASGTTVLSGASQTVTLSGVTISTVLSGGSQVLSAGGLAQATSVLSGGSQTVSGGVASGTILSTGGTQEIAVQGVASGTVVQGGIETVDSGGLATGTTVSAGGTLIVSSGGTATLTVLSSGGTLVNHGTTSTTSGVGVVGSGGGATITNDGVIIGTGLTSGTGRGISIDGGTVTNAGTIIGLDGTAIAFGGTTSNRLILTPASVISGIVSATSSASNTLELGATSGATLSGYTSGYLGFQTIQVDSGGTWDIAGTNTLGTVVNSGTVLVSDTDTLHVTSATGSGGYVVSGHGKLTFDGGVDAGQTVTLTGSAATLTIHDPTDFAGTVAGFARKDVIDLDTVAFASATATLSGSTIAVHGGGHSYTIQLAAPITDSALKLSADTNGELVITLVPPVTAALVNDTGVSPSDFITSDASLTGFADPNATVVLTEGSTTLGSATADGSGLWTFSPTLADGAHTIVATDTDSGNSVGSTAISFTLDTTAPATPTIGLTSGTDSNVIGDGLTNVNTPTLAGTGENGTTVVLSDGVNTLGSATVVSGGWSIPISSSITDGAYVLTVTDTDAAGNTASATFSMTIDTTPPAPPVIGIATPDDTGALGDGITSVTQPAFIGSGTAGDLVELYISGAVVGSATVDSSGTFSVAPTSALVDGGYIVTVVETDAAGNASSASAPFSLTIDTTDDGAPTGLALLAADDTGIQGDDTTGVSQPHITGSGTADDTITLYEGGSVIGSGTVGSGGTFSIAPTSALTAGAHTISATQTDAAGNVSPASTAYTLHIAAAPDAPVISLDAGSDSGVLGDNITNFTMPAIVGSGSAGDTIRLYEGATLLGSATVTVSGTFSVAPISALADGGHSLTVTETDTANNVSNPSNVLSLTIDATTDPAPTGVVLDPGSDSGVTGDAITNVTTPAFTGSGTAGDTVTLYDGSTVLGTAVVAGDGTFSVAPTSGLADGSYSLTLTETDPAGNESTATAAPSITINTVPPAAPSAPTLDVASRSGTSNSVTSFTTPTLDGTGTAGDTVTVYDGSTVIGTATVDGSGNYSIVPQTALADGSYDLTAREVDPVGNQSAASSDFVLTIDTTSPATPTLALDPASDTGISNSDRITNNATPTFTGTSEPGATIYLFGPTLLGTATAAGDGSFSITPSAALPDGTRTFSIQAVDAAGNTSSIGNAIQVKIDTTADLAPTNLALAMASDSGIVGDAVTNATTPAITGLGVAGHTVTLYDSSTAVGTAVVGSNGRFSVAPTTALTDGVHGFTVKQTDPAGNVSAASSTLSITIDTVADAAPTALALDPADDSGVSSDDLTNVVQPTITGDGVAGDTVMLYDGATLVGTDVVAGDGTFSIAVTSPLADGVHSLTVQQVNAAGNVSAASSALSLTIDTTAPSAPTPALATASDSGVLGDRITSVTQPAITGTGTQGDTVTLYDGVTAIGSTTIGMGGAFSITPGAALNDGVHVLRLTETDPAGNTSSQSAPLSLTIDTTADAAPTGLAILASSDSGLAGDNLTNVTTPAITGVGVAGHTVTLYDGATAVGTATVGSNGRFSVAPSSALTEGAHPLTVKQTDPAGNVSAASQTLTVTIDTTADAAPAGLTLSAVDDSGVAGDNLTNITQPTVTGNGVAGSTATLFDGNTALGSIVVAQDGTFAITPTITLSDGLHNLTATQTDPAGNVSAASAPLSLTIDTVAPTVSTPALATASDSGTVGDGITNITHPTITGTGVTGDVVTLRDGMTVIGTATVDGSGAFAITPAAALANGVHSLTITGTDPAGNVSATSSPFVLTIDTIADAAPSGFALDPSSDSGALGDNLTNVAAPFITGSGTAGHTITLYDGVTLVGTAVVGNGGTFSIAPSTALSDGLHSFTLTSTDPAGNVSVASAALPVTIDTTADAAPGTLALDAGSDSGTVGDGLTNVTTPVITGTGTAGDTVTLLDGATVVGTAVVGGNGAWSVTTSTLADGVHSLTATQADVAGNASAASAALALTIDTTVPAAPTALALDPGSDSGTVGDGLTNVTTPVITGTGTVGDAVTLLDGATVVGTAVVGGNGAWSVTTSALVNGVHSLTATQADAAGTVSVASSPLALTINSTVPGAPTTLALDTGSDSGVLGDGLTNVTTPVITGTGTAGDTVTLRDGATVVGTAVVGGNGAWSVTASTLADGVHSLTATQADSGANVSTASAPLVLTIDTTADAAPGTLALDAGSDSGTVGDRLTNVTTPVITGTGTVGDAVTLLDGATVVGTGIVGGNGAWSITASALAGGVHSLTARQSDPAANLSAASSPLVLTIDTAVPAALGPLALAVASDSGLVGDGLTNVATPVITGTGTPGDTVSLRDGLAVVGTGVVGEDGTWSVTISATLADGTHTLTATQAAASGTVSASSGSLALTIDTTPPAAPTIGQPVASTNPAQPVVSGTAPGASIVRLYQDSTSVGTVAVANGAWSFSYATPLAAGQYALTATASDAAGNLSATSSPVSLSVNGDASYAVTAPGTTEGTTKSYVYDGTGTLNKVDTYQTAGQLLLTSVTDTTAVIQIYDTSGTLIGTIAQPSISAYSQPIFDTTPKTLAASTGSGPIGSVVDLLSETNTFVSQGVDTITVHSGTAHISAMGPSTTVTNIAANLTFFGNASTTTVYGGSGTITAVGGTGGGTLVGGTAGHNVLVAGGGTTTLTGGGDGDVLFGSADGTDMMFAGPGHEILIGGGGTTTIVTQSGSVAFGGSGTSTLFGTANTVLVGGSGNSTLLADTGYEVLVGGSGNSTLWGGFGQNVMFGNGDVNSATVMHGGLGNAVFLAAAGTSTIDGGDGNATIWGSSGSLTVNGGNGADTIVFGTGSTTVNGGPGADLYVFINGLSGGNDMINNFRPGTDHISLTGYESTVQTSVSGGNTTLLLSDHTVATFVGVTSLTPDNFV